MRPLTATQLRDMRSIAEDVRNLAERVAERDGYPDDLCGLCLRASGTLFRRYKAAHIPCTLCIYAPGGFDSHAFVLVNGEHVVDVTATQFDEVGPVTYGHVWERGFWKVDREFRTLREAMEHQQQIGWPRGQQIRTRAL